MYDVVVCLHVHLLWSLDTSHSALLYTPKHLHFTDCHNVTRERGRERRERGRERCNFV